MRRAFISAAVAALMGTASAQTLKDCRDHHRRGRLEEARWCFVQQAQSADAYLRAEGLWGAGDYQAANAAFRLAVEQHPKNPDYRVRWGRLFLERRQPQDAADLFAEALKLRGDHAGALLGLALQAAEQFESKAVELAEQAAALDRNLVEARELLARLALEENNSARAIQQADQALAISAEALDAMAVRATMDWLNDRPSTAWLERILKLNPVYGEVYAMAGRFFVLNRRYEEGIAFYRKALELNPRLWEARAQLGLNLMRLGADEEARRHLELCYRNGYQSDATVNSLRLLDSYGNFVIVQSGPGVLKLHKKEAAILRPYFERELQRGLRAFEQKYRMKLTRPVRVEVYPDHEDFAVRTLGMPGLGALGVSFGYVVAMDSPSGRRPGHYHWASTLWHELSHVFVLAATRHRAPRWFTEGMAVYEETVVAPDWGDRLTPEIILAIREWKLLPVAELDRGFVRPSYPSQVVVSYYQAGRICAYIVEKWGFEKLLEMLQAFGELRGTPEVIEQALGMKPEQFDRQFRAWLEAATQATVKNFDEWKKRIADLNKLARAQDYDAVMREGGAVRDLFPEYVEAGNAYQLMAEACFAQGRKPDAVAELQRYAAAGGKDPALLKKLAAGLEEMGRRKAAARALERLNYIYPQDEELHRKLGELLLAEGDAGGAVREFEAAIALQPVDAAASHYQLARALRQAGRLAEAKERVLLALEAAPGYRPAQKMLLELTAEENNQPKGTTK